MEQLSECKNQDSERKIQVQSAIILSKGFYFLRLNHARNLIMHLFIEVLLKKPSESECKNTVAAL